MALKNNGEQMRSAFLYSERFASANYGSGHPMRPARLGLTRELIGATGLLDLADAALIDARKAAESEILTFHTPEYLKALKEANAGTIPVSGAEFGLGYGDNPVFRGVYEWSSWCTGASVQAAELVASGEVGRAFNIAGGLHHAMPARASGFCYINDPVAAINLLLSRGKRVAYVDIDAHHGDGVEYAYYDSDRVLTISIHESGQWLFPGTGNVTDIGIGRGEGYAVNLPLEPGAGDAEFTEAFEKLIPDFIGAFDPDVLVTQLGVDTFASDPVAHLNLTTDGFEEMVRGFRSFELPWVALGGGGYDLANVARAWTLAWAIICDATAPETIPEAFMDANRDIFKDDRIRDIAGAERGGTLGHVGSNRTDIDKMVGYLKKEALPLVRKPG
jgi:acetoin utilization protein AcuC